MSEVLISGVLFRIESKKITYLFPSWFTENEKILWIKKHKKRIHEWAKSYNLDSPFKEKKESRSLNQVGKFKQQKNG